VGKQITFLHSFQPFEKLLKETRRGLLERTAPLSFMLASVALPLERVKSFHKSVSLERYLNIFED